MTKNKKDLRCVKNRTWERDRRERLNNTFESLAKLLPEYEPQVTFSKIEILQKTIAYIEQLKVKFQEASTGTKDEHSRNQNQLEECLRKLKIHNDILVDLLQKSNIAIPPFAEPNILDNINFKKAYENKGFQKCQNSSLSKRCKIKQIEPELEKSLITSAKNVTSAELFNTEDRHTLIETPTLAVADTPEPATQSGIHRSSNGNTMLVSLSQSASGNVKKCAKTIKSTLFQNLNEPDSQHKDKTTNNERLLKTKNTQTSNDLLAKILPSFRVENKSNQCSSADGSESQMPQLPSSNANILNHCDFYSDTLITPAENAGNSDKISKSNSLLDDIQSPQIDLSPTLLSPTAAFLLSFPVVSSALAKPVEPVVNYVESVHKIKQSSSPRILSENIKSSDFNEDFSNIDSVLNRSTKHKFSSRDSSACAQIQEVNNCATHVNASPIVRNTEKRFKFSAVSPIKPSMANPFANNTFTNIKIPSYDQSYSSFWSENSTAFQNAAHSYGLPYYLRNAPNTSPSSTPISNECEKSSIYKNITSKADTMPIYQPNQSQMLWDKRTEPAKKCSLTSGHLNHSKHLVNWMTTDSNNHSKGNISTPPDSIGSFMNAYHFPSQADDVLVNTSSRLLDSSSNFISEPTLPNLNGDLALGTISASTSCIQSTGNTARHLNIQVDTLTDNTNYQRVNNFSAESLFSNVVPNNIGPDTKKTKHSNDYFRSPQDINSDVGYVSNAIPAKSFLPPNFESINCSTTIGNTFISQMPSNGLHYTHYSIHQNEKTCNNRINSGITNRQLANDINKNKINNFSSKSQLSFAVPVFRDCFGTDLGLANVNYKTEFGEQIRNKCFDLPYTNNTDADKPNKNLISEEATTNIPENFVDKYSDRSTYATHGQLHTENKAIYLNSSTKSKSQIPCYNHSSSVPVNINPETTNTISSTITNFNLSTICPEIDRDFLIK